MIDKLRLVNFRRFVDTTVQLDTGLSYIEGKNNAGKSSLFMAIEYGLFGSVTGFRSQTGLFSPKADKMGVEIHYTGKNGELFKLQRMHEKTGKSLTSAKGHYTLKVKEGEVEKYLVSSDFEGHSEEMLQLQVFESLGISKRLFDVAVNIRQGEITSILEGTNQLDIVLGVSAAVIAQKQLNAVALGFEKETSQYDLIKANLDQFNTQKNELEKQSATLGKNIEKMRSSHEEMLKDMTTIEKKVESFQQVLDPFSQYRNTISQWDRNFQRVVDHLQLQDQLVKDAGEPDKLNDRLDDTKKMIEGVKEKIEEQETSRKDLQTTIRTTEQKRGDISGKLQRRKNLPEGETPTCEECGSPIDLERVKAEIIEWEKEISTVDKEVNLLEEKSQATSNEINQKRTQLTELTSQKTKIEGYINQLSSLKQRSEELSKALETTSDLMMEQVVAVYESLQDYNEGLKEDNRIKVGRPNLPEDDPPIALESDVLQARYMADVYSPLFEKEKQKLAKERNEITVEARVRKGQLDDKETQLSNLKPGLEKLNREIARAKEGLALLQRKRKAAEDMRHSAKIFKNLQEVLRDRAANSLATKTLAFHKELSESDNIEDLRVDPKKYAIFVKPDDVGEEVPAHSYQGGGHKLLLGLAFKLAIVSLVTKPPFILLDEPTYGLDTSNKINLFEKIGKLTQSQLLLITHQRHSDDIGGKMFEVIKEGKTSTVEAKQ